MYTEDDLKYTIPASKEDIIVLNNYSCCPNLPRHSDLKIQGHVSQENTQCHQVSQQQA